MFERDRDNPDPTGGIASLVSTGTKASFLVVVVGLVGVIGLVVVVEYDGDGGR
jgi:hypothetical protein